MLIHKNIENDIELWINAAEIQNQVYRVVKNKYLFISTEKLSA